MAHHRTAILAFAAVLAQAVPAASQTCPQPLHDARRLVVVTANGMSTSAATLRTFQRAKPGDRWRRIGTPLPARLGRAGMGWSYPFREFRRGGEPVKVEGDKRAPAGIYRIGHSFGFAASRRPHYLRLTQDTICVNDVKSPAYNTITSRKVVGRHVSAETMRGNSNYRQGLIVKYPTNAAARAGSCIFIHVWRAPAKPTTGCVALAEAHVEALQDFTAAGAVLAIVPRGAIARFSGCLPRADGNGIN